MGLLILSDLFDYENYQRQIYEFIEHYSNRWKSILRENMVEKFKKKIMQPGYFVEFISKPESHRIIETEYAKIISKRDSPTFIFPRGSIRKYPLMFTEISLPND